MKIYSALGVELLDLIVDDKSYRYKVIMDENTMTLYFNMPDFHEIPEGSYCDYKNERYFLLDPENFKQNHSRDFEYTLVLDSFQSLTKQVKYKFFTMNAGVIDSAFELKFSLTATPSEFAQLLINNMNVWDADGGWSVGECIESDPVCIDFNHDWCYDVLPKVSDAFKTEWEFENKTLHIRKVEKMKESPIPLKYGYDCGLLPGVSRSNASNAKIITRLFIEGGDRNIDKSTYGSSALRMPKNHTITYMGIDYKTDATGTYIERVTPLGRLKEGSLDVTKIYPKRIGTVSAVNVVNADTNLYDVIDSSIPGTLDFSALVIAGETMTIIFQTGQLAGKEFEVKYKSADKRFELVPLSENGLNYPSGSLIPEVGDKYAVFNISLPTDYITSAETDVLNDAVKYLWENEQPKYTVTGTLDAIYAKRNWLAIGGFLNCGYFVSLTSDEFLPTPIDIRIVAVKEYINKPKEPEITLSNEVSGKTLGSELNKTSTQEQAINRKDAEVVRFARRQFSDIKQTTEMLQNSLLNFSSSISPLTVQTMQLIAGDETLQFEFVSSSTSTTSVAHNESYNPDTKQFSSAAGILQHKTLGVTTLSSAHAASELKWWNMTAFVSAVLDDSSKSYYLYAKVSKTANTGIFLLSETAIALESIAGYYHLLMGILNSENDGDRSYSQMYGYSELTPARMTVKKVVSPSGNTFFDLENEVIQGNIKFQSGVTVETGISNAKSEAVQLASNDATTKANSAKDTAISTASADATNKANAAKQTAQDYATAQAELAELNAKAHADGIVTAEEQRAINDATTKANNAQTAAINAAAIDATSKANNAIQTSKEYSDAKVAVINQSLADLQTQSDGAVSNWPSNTQTEAPTLSNFPANQWTSNTERDRHILDVYTNYQEYISDVATPNAGKSWKFVKSESGVYSWALIADNNQSKAYLMSVKATAIANQKITTFSTIPNTLMADGFCYRKGDLWSLQAPWNGFTAGELLSAAQDSTSFVSSDWTKWVKYTDDSAVNNLKVGGVNLIKGTTKNSSLSTPNWVHLPLSAPLVEGKEYILSGEFTFPYATSGFIGLNNYDYGTNAIGLPQNTPFIATAEMATKTHIAYCNQTGNGIVVVNYLQLELGNKATAWKEAPEDTAAKILEAKQSGDNAQSSANTANSSVLNLNNYIDGSFKDEVISQSEAQAIEKYKNQVTKDFNDLISVYSVIYANSYLVGSAKTDLLNAKVSMSGAKDNLLSSINTAIADGKTTVSEKADVDSKYSIWDSSYSTYKGKLELANKAIQANLESLSQNKADNAQNAATAVANGVQANLNNLQIGGRNLVVGSNMIGAVSLYGVYGDIQIIQDVSLLSKQIFKIHNIVRIDGSDLVFYFPVLNNPNLMSTSILDKNIMVSFFIKSNNSQLLTGIGANNTVIGTEWVKIQGNTTYYGGNFHYSLAGNGLSEVFIHSFKIEFGNKATDWTEAPEDDYVKKAIKGSASINGGLVLGNVMAVTDENDNMTAGMSGFDDNIAFWGGGTYQQATDSSTNPSAIPVIDRKDGSGHRAKGNLLWTKEGILKMIGGFIGNFAIIGGRIVGKNSAGEERIVLSTGDIPDINALSSGYTNCYFNNYVGSEPSKVVISGNFFGGSEAYPALTEAISVEIANFNVPYATVIKFNSFAVNSLSISNSQCTVNSFGTYAKIYKNNVFLSNLAIGASLSISEACAIRAEMITTLSVYIPENLSSGYEISAVGNTVISYEEYRAKTEFGSNGFYSRWSDSLVMYFSAIRGFVVRGATDIPAGLGGATVSSGGVVTSIWGKIDATNKVLKSGNNYTITHNIGDTDYTIIPIADSANIPYRTSKTANTIVIVCAGGFDFILVRTK